MSDEEVIEQRLNALSEKIVEADGEGSWPIMLFVLTSALVVYADEHGVGDEELIGQTVEALRLHFKIFDRSEMRLQ